MAEKDLCNLLLSTFTDGLYNWKKSSICNFSFPGQLNTVVDSTCIGPPYGTRSMFFFYPFLKEKNIFLVIPPFSFLGLFFLSIFLSFPSCVCVCDTQNGFLKPQKRKSRTSQWRGGYRHLFLLPQIHTLFFFLGFHSLQKKKIIGRKENAQGTAASAIQQPQKDYVFGQQRGHK